MWVPSWFQMPPVRVNDCFPRRSGAGQVRAFSHLAIALVSFIDVLTSAGSVAPTLRNGASGNSPVSPVWGLLAAPGCLVCRWMLKPSPHCQLHKIITAASVSRMQCPNMALRLWVFGMDNRFGIKKKIVFSLNAINALMRTALILMSNKPVYGKPNTQRNNCWF